MGYSGAIHSDPLDVGLFVDIPTAAVLSPAGLSGSSKLPSTADISAAKHMESRGKDTKETKQQRSSMGVSNYVDELCKHWD